MTYATQVIALSRSEAQRFRSSDPYVVISLTDTDSEHPEIAPEPALKERLSLHFDDIYPEHCIAPNGDRLFCAMQEADAEYIAAFVRRWWGQVATIVVHCHAGLSRSTGVAAAIRRHHGQDERDLFEIPRSPNRHCLTLVAQALVRAGVVEG
jgi:predicted protein tyrosine phosphatase